MTKEQLTAIIQYTIDVENQQGGCSIDPEKHLTFQVLELTTCFKVEFTWICEMKTVGQLDDRETQLTHNDTYFKLLPTDSNNKLYSYIMDCLIEVENNALIIN